MPRQTPVDAVTLNEPVGDLHHLDEVHLLSVGGVARVLEDQWCGRRRWPTGIVTGVYLGYQTTRILNTGADVAQARTTADPTDGEM